MLTSAPFQEPLENGIVVCRVSSWMTGTRLVSLPFSDHCEPLLREGEGIEEFARWMRETCDLQHWRYAELRPLLADYRGWDNLQPSSSYWYHELDLSPGLDEIFGRLHKNSFQRMVRRARRKQLSYEAGCSERLVDEFYELLLRTRMRQQLFPQPKGWFKNLLECMGNKLQVRVARKDGVPIAGLLTLRHGTSLVYKYGCSNERFHNLGGVPFLFWRLVEESKATGVEKIDFGRTDLDHAGLIAFKDRLGTSRKLLTYYRHAKIRTHGLAYLRHSRTIRQFFSLLPEAVSSAAGKMLYRHLG